MEILIIIITVAAIVAVFEFAIIKEYKKSIKDLKQTIDEQEDFIKILQSDYDIAMQNKFKELREKFKKT